MLVVGAGCGGMAAALAAARMGCSVVLTEPTRWVGGQLTSQAVPADEHPWIESTGATASYRQMREAVRQRYRDTLPLTEEARQDPHLNPGKAWVSAIAAEPVVIHAVLRDLLRAEAARGPLHLLLSTVPVSADVHDDRVEAVSFTGPEGDVTVTAGYVLDATEEGDLLPLTGCEHVVGAESAADTGEPHALDGPADPFDQQAAPGASRWSGCPGTLTSSAVRLLTGSGVTPRRRTGPALSSGGRRQSPRPDSRCAARCSARRGSRTCGASGASGTAPPGCPRSPTSRW